jgi:ATP-dependent DNA ligase
VRSFSLSLFEVEAASSSFTGDIGPICLAQAKAEAFEAACGLGQEGIVSKRLTAPYKSGPCKSWIKMRNPKSSAYLRIAGGSWT